MDFAILSSFFGLLFTLYLITAPYINIAYSYIEHSTVEVTLKRGIGIARAPQVSFLLL